MNCCRNVNTSNICWDKHTPFSINEKLLHLLSGQAEIYS
jgi:hypothetical protein